MTELTRLDHIRLARVCGAEHHVERLEKMTDEEYEAEQRATMEKAMQHATDTLGRRWYP